MLVPALIYGVSAEVKRRSRRVVTQIKRGATLAEAMGADRLIDTNEHEGLFNLNYPAPDLARLVQYHILLPMSAVWGAMVNGPLTWDLEDPLFYACLDSDWGVLMLLSHTLSCWHKQEHRWVPYLRAAARAWPVLAAEGVRYSDGGLFHLDLAHMVTSVDYILGNAGIYLFKPGPNPTWPLGPFRPPNWPALVEAYAARRAQGLH